MCNPLCRTPMESVTEFKKCHCACCCSCRKTGHWAAETRFTCKMPLSLDAREVLMHLNEMGYRNITAEQLKEFLQDLRKLIKYEERLGVLDRGTEDAVNKRFEMLHKASTASFRAKTKASKSAENRCSRMKDSGKVTPKKSTSNKCVKQAIPREGTASSPKEKKKEKSKMPINLAEKKSKMWIRPRSAAGSSTGSKSCDPVHLYKFYSEQWKKFKDNLPGEGDRTQLRWDIRQRLLGA